MPMDTQHISHLDLLLDLIKRNMNNLNYTLEQISNWIKTEAKRLNPLPALYDLNEYLYDRGLPKVRTY